jgi:hypothetical protein
MSGARRFFVIHFLRVIMVNKWLILFVFWASDVSLRGQVGLRPLSDPHDIGIQRSSICHFELTGALSNTELHAASNFRSLHLAVWEPDKAATQVWSESEAGIWSFVAGWLFLMSAIQVALLFACWKAIRAHATLQKGLNQQWVDVGNWSVGGAEPWDTASEAGKDRRVETEKSRKLKDSLSIVVNFEISNRTQNPLSIDTVVVLAGILKKDAWQWKTFEDTATLLLPPNATDRENSEAFSISIDLKAEEILRYATDGFYMRIHVKVFYFNSAGKRISQDFPVEAVLKPGTPTVFTKHRNRRIRETERRRTEDESPNDAKSD